MDIRTNKKGTKRSKDFDGITTVECTAEEMAVYVSECMGCQNIYRVRVFDASGIIGAGLRTSHGYCDNCEPLTGGI